MYVTPSFDTNSWTWGTRYTSLTCCYLSLAFGQTLTMVYHITYRKINIRKETSTSISVFSMASYLSMVALLVQQHWDRSDWLELPFVAVGLRLLQGGGDVVVKVAKYANITVEP